MDYLDLMGANYILEHVISEANNRMRREMYEVYMSDIGSGIVTALGAKGVRRYYDYIHPPKAETKTAQEITDDIIARAGLKRKGGNANGSIKPDGDAGT